MTTVMHNTAKYPEETAIREKKLRTLLQEERALERQRLALALRDTYTEIYEIDLEGDTSILLFSNSQNLSPVCGDLPVANSAIIENSVHPDDRQKMRSVFDAKGLCARFAAGEAEVRTEFRRLRATVPPLPKEKQNMISAEPGYHWVSALIVPMISSSAIAASSKVLLFIKDISDRRLQEEQGQTLEQYGLALRNIYDIFFEFSPAQDSYRLVHLAKDSFVMPPVEGHLSHLISESVEHLVHPADKSIFSEFFDVQNLNRDFCTHKGLRMMEFRHLHMNGNYHWMAVTMFPLNKCHDAEHCYLVFGLDIQARKVAEEMAIANLQLQRQRIVDERYRVVVEQTSTVIFEWRNGICSLAPELAQRFAGVYDARDIFDVWMEDGVVHPHDMPRFVLFQRARGMEKHREMTVRLMQRNGLYLWCKVTVADLDADDKGQYSLGTINDVDAATRAVLALRKRAERDVLTGVYNMRTFYKQAEARMRRNPKVQFYVIRLDIDGFKIINDLYGLNEGDRLLRKLGLTLQTRMTEHSVCGRIGADVFCCCVDFDRDGIERFVQEVVDVMSQYPLPSAVIPSFGICRVDSVATPVSTLCDWANLALKTVKGNAITLHAFYDETLRQSILRDKSIESEMRDALANGEFKLYLQPKVHIASGLIVGAEGLVRWEHPQRGLIAPDDFIPLFEKNGFILPLDEFMWEEACKLLRAWQDAGKLLLPLSVNVSRLHIRDSRFCEKLEALVKNYTVPVELLELELTESVFLDNKPQVFQSIERLRALGFRFSLDDFGAGYSSLNILKSLPMDTLKLDKAFLDEVATTGKGRAIVTGVIALTKSIDMKVLAEGVESLEQAKFLKENGCALAQGYYYSPPVPPDVFENLLLGNTLPVERDVAKPV